MTTVTITIKTDAAILGVFLLHPGSNIPEPLPGTAQSVKRNLRDGVYYVAISGSGLAPKTKIEIHLATQTSQCSDNREVDVDGTIGSLLPFRVSGGDVEC